MEDFSFLRSVFTFEFGIGIVMAGACSLAYLINSIRQYTA